MSLPRTSKDLDSCPSSALPQNLDHQFLQYSNNLADFNNSNKNSSQKNIPKKILLKSASSQKIPPKNFLQKNSYQKIPPKKFPIKFPTKSKKIPKKNLRF